MRLLIAVTTFTLLVSPVVLSAAPNEQQRRDIMSACEVATGTQTGERWKTNRAAANTCYLQVMEDLRQKEIQQAYRERDRAETAYLRDKSRSKIRIKELEMSPEDE